MEESYTDFFGYFVELSTKLKLAEENNNLLSRQIQDYKSKSDNNIKIIHEKQKLVSLLFFNSREHNISTILCSYSVNLGARSS